MSSTASSLAYLVASICFILSLKGLSSPKTSRSGNFLGIIGMIIAISTTFYHPVVSSHSLIIIAVVIGAVIGSIIALKIKMTAMPQLVAAFHSLVGLAAVLIASSAYMSPESYGIGLSGQISVGNLLEMSLGAAIGAITFTGSIIAFAKLQNLISGKAIKIGNHKLLNIAFGLIILYVIYSFCCHPSGFKFLLLSILALAYGAFLVLPVGGADMPVVVSLLNSYSGWAAAGIGFTMGNSLLIITGALVGSSGAILSYIMCKAMNRSIFNILLGTIETGEQSQSNSQLENKPFKIMSPEDAAFLLKNSASVIIVPGYGMAVAHAQHVIKELCDILEKEGVSVKFAIHPVAGRMPGHMNVLLAEANIGYDKVFELEDINRDFPSTDITLVIGANDITNPAANNDPTSPIYGMPILEVEKSKNVLFIKRSLSSGYAGIDNELFYKNNTQMLLGDAKKVIEELLKMFHEV